MAQAPGRFSFQSFPQEIVDAFAEATGGQRVRFDCQRPSTGTSGLTISNARFSSSGSPILMDRKA